MKSDLITKEDFLQKIDRAYEEMKEKYGSKTIDKIETSYYSKLPKEDKDLLELFDYFVTNGEWRAFWLVTKWIKKRSFYELEYMSTYEKWLDTHIDSWGKCDAFCYRVLNPMIEKYPQLYEKVQLWTESPQTYIRRAAAVSLLKSTQSFEVNYPLDKVLFVVEQLRNDKEEHVQKGVGWLLKYAYLSYPEEIYSYLEKNVKVLPRIIFRYALEKMPKKEKMKLMAL